MPESGLSGIRSVVSTVNITRRWEYIYSIHYMDPFMGIRSTCTPRASA